MFLAGDSMVILVSRLRIRKFLAKHEETGMSIAIGKVFEPFIAERPVRVMARGVSENLLNPGKIDALCGIV